MQSTIGILGGGQLGLMLAESVDRLGSEVVVLDPDPNCPCARRRNNVLIGAFDDAAALRRFFEAVDVATYDTENTPGLPLQPWAQQLVPSLRVLTTTQDRTAEKSFLQHGGAPFVPYQALAAGTPLRQAALQFGLPLIAKRARGGYDGKGQMRVSAHEDLAALPELADGAWVFEEVVDVVTELSCIVARTGDYSFAYSLFENRHRSHILDLSVIPAQVPNPIEALAERVAQKLARELEVRGLLTVEFFYGRARDGVLRLYVNELAPRVHNSGHLTRQAYTASQFDILARILAGLVPSVPQRFPGAFCMVQLLGDVWIAQGRAGGALDLSAWDRFPSVLDVYLYGKVQARPGRKMGHAVARGTTPAQAIETAVAFRDALMATRAG